jgi:rare lipoprotein A
MKRWLIILCLASAAAAPGPATAAAKRPPEVPFWTRLLAVIVPSRSAVRSSAVRSSAVRPYAGAERHYRHEHTRMTAAAEEANSPQGRARRVRQSIETGVSGGEQAPDTLAQPVRESVGVAANDARDAAPLRQAAPPWVASQYGALAASPAESEEIPPLPRAAPRRTARQDIFASSPEEEDALPVLVPATPPSRARPASEDGCNGGQRIVSAYYWEGRHTASGEPFNPNGMTAAHRTLPFGTRVTVSNPRTGRSVTVVINDRGPYVRGVSLDLTIAAAKAIGMHGTGSVCIL